MVILKNPPIYPLTSSNLIMMNLHGVDFDEFLPAGFTDGPNTPFRLSFAKSPWRAFRCDIIAQQSLILLEVHSSRRLRLLGRI